MAPWANAQVHFHEPVVLGRGKTARRCEKNGFASKQTPNGSINFPQTFILAHKYQNQEIPEPAPMLAIHTHSRPFGTRLTVFHAQSVHSPFTLPDLPIFDNGHVAKLLDEEGDSVATR